MRGDDPGAPPVPPTRVLVVDDERNIRTTLRVCLEQAGCEVTDAASDVAARDLVRRQRFDVAFVDLRLGDASGIELIPALLEACRDLAIVIITAYGTIDTAVSAIKAGASDYLTKPFSPAQIRLVVDQLAERRALHGRVAQLEQVLADAVPEIDLDTRSPAMQTVLTTVDRVAAVDAPVLLRGESGTGKGVVARTLHARSPRAARPFVTVNCPTLAEDLLTSELFGHVRGAFTGAVRDQAGLVEAADGGTLFLDEIGEIAPGLQAKLLRFLQDKQFERLGDTQTRRADVRIIAATNRDLDADVRGGRFREDLLYRINVVELVLPPLRERPEDILPLARRFLAFFAAAVGRPAMELSPAGAAVLTAYRWPGNVRELRNAIERAAILWPAPVVEPAAFIERIAGVAAAGPQLGGECTLDAIEREHIVRVLARTATIGWPGTGELSKLAHRPQVPLPTAAPSSVRQGGPMGPRLEDAAAVLGWVSRATRSPAGYRYTGTSLPAEQATYDFVSRKVEVLGDVVEDPSQGPDAQRGVSGNRNVMLPALRGRQTQMAPGLSRGAIAERLEGFGEVVARDISRQSHAEITSSRTK